MQKLIPLTRHDTAAENALNVAEKEGYRVRQIIKNKAAVFASTGVVAYFLMEKPTTDLVQDILYYLDLLKDEEINDLIDNLPESFVDRICQLCDDPYEGDADGQEQIEDIETAVNKAFERINEAMRNAGRAELTRHNSGDIQDSIKLLGRLQRMAKKALDDLTAGLSDELDPDTLM